MGKNDNTHRKKLLYDIVALLIIAWGILTFVSLISFNPNDSGFFTNVPNRPVKNLGGITGAFVSSLLFLSFGRGSFILPIIIIMIGWYMLIKKDINDASLPIVGLILFLLTFSTLSSISVIKGTPFVLIKSGGAVGLFFSVKLKDYVGITGLYITAISFIFFSLMLVTNFSLRSVAIFFADLLKGFVNIKDFFIRLFKPQIVRTEDEKPPLLSKVSEEIKEKKFFDTPVDIETEQDKKSIVLFKSSKKENKVLSLAKVSDFYKYEFPPLNLLNLSEPFDEKKVEKSTYETARKLEATLRDFDISAKVIDIHRGPVITRYAIELAPGVKLSKIVGLSDNIALSLAAQRVRIVAPIPGKAAVGVEIPNNIRATVTLGDILSLPEFNKNYELIELALGKDISGAPVKIDLKDCPHLLIAGATGSGKSVCLNSIIVTLLYKVSPAELRFIMIDPKMVELKVYNGIPHLLTEVVTNPKDAILVLKYVVEEMEKRYHRLDEMGVRDIDRYNIKAKKRMKRDESIELMPYIVVVIDEFADLMMMVAREIEDLIVRLAQKARAVGIHLIIATQRPSVDVITGIIKANFPSRIAFQVASRIDSRTILDTIGAEKLLGKGDMLLSFGGRPGLVRIQGAYISEEEIEKIVDFIVENSETIEYINLNEIVNEIQAKEIENSIADNEDEEDMFYEKAKEIIKETKKASASYLQRRLKIGFNRAARIIDQLERDGLIGPQIGSKPREVYLDKL